MNKQELRALLKPLIKELIKEVLLTEPNVLSHIITETLKSRAPALPKEQPIYQQKSKKPAQLLEHKKKLLEAINKDAYGGIDLFEGTTPIAESTPEAGALANLDPNDAGIDLSAFTDGISMANKLFKMSKK